MASRLRIDPTAPLKRVKMGSYEDPRISCPGHRGQPRTRPGLRPGARGPASVTEPGVTPVALDITDPDRVAQVAQECADVSLLVNNAGILKYSTFIGAPGLDAARAEMETNYFGTLSMCRAFAPVLAANG